MAEKSPVKADVERIFNQWLNAPELRSEVRGYLRHRLFTALHNSRLGPGLSHLDAHPVSPKLHTLNLLIAEYLLKQRHHFTLSVFSCEAPNVSCISPNVPEMLKVQSQASGQSTHVFSKDDFDDIVQTLGMPKESELVQELKAKYESGKHQALITCILRCLPDIFTPRLEEQKCEKEPNVQTEVLNSERVKNEEITVLMENFHQELHSKDETIKELTVMLENAKVIQETGLVDSLQEKIKAMEFQFRNFEMLKEKEVANLKKLNRALESDMDELQGNLESRKKHLREEEFRVEKEKLALKRNKKKLEKHQKQLDEVSIALTENFPDQSTLPALEIQLQIKEQELVELRSKYLGLQDENKMLNSLTNQQRNHIESLNDKITSLVYELHSYKERSLRLRHSASEGDSSPTDDVVKDARQRIKSLEIEYEAIEKQHREFRNRSVDAPSFENLFVPTPQKTTFQPAAHSSGNRTPRVVDEIQTNIKAIYESVQSKPERLSPRKLKFEAPRVKLLDISASSISSESTGIEPKAKGSSLTGAGISRHLDESISPIFPEQPRSPAPAKSPAKAPSSPELSEIKLNLDPEALGTSDELKLTIPSSSSGDSTNIVEATRLETTVTDKVKSAQGNKAFGRSQGDGMVVSSTSEDKSEPAIDTAAAGVDDDDFWD